MKNFIYIIYLDNFLYVLLCLIFTIIIKLDKMKKEINKI